MSQTDNLFDTAMSIADDTIISVMGTTATITSGVLAGTSLTGVFDDPESVSYAAGGVRIEGVSPSFFVKSSAVRQLKRADTLVIGGCGRFGGQNYWVDRMGPEESSGSRVIWLGTGDPPTDTRRR
ncbi:phage tail protein [Salmonella enterica]|uniref:Phage tail protein n=1 Tax=Salmonella enterica subsp. enterica serovar Java TaxID=224729 RepID=A0A3Y9C384_SALEB|nr:phage tail protein [Salmonella enterica subsp. enterica serovar Java]EAO5315618.1 phage tail protein [Salmonella enterica]ECC3210143.1 phage tail protein [Salmonella enterica subsp. diarizonae]ECD0154672.1 phage tail protein [Salmonella enterica subsp. enterica]EEE1039819.1 phage tail protein [Salmonella enterica subsp. enterica serovar Miami]EEP4262175.1 phage tail protein [Salmonella enterica subsp. enterica serovar Oranienburg]HCM8924225.1 phage tail protein [Salmonella enterica subsp. 